jgi:hypothetical protein
MKWLLIALVFLGRTALAENGGGGDWYDRQATPLRGEYAFQDADLAAFLEQNPQAAIYVWSPHMPLSVRGIPAFLQAARELALPALLLLDPQADDAYARRVANLAALPAEALRRLRSLSLIRRAALLHYPSVLVFSGGALRGSAIAGSRENAWKTVLARKMKGEGNETRPDPLLTAVAAPVHVRKLTPLPGSDFGYFAKPVWGTRWASVHKDWSSSYFFNLDDGRLLDTGTVNDTFVSPTDHRYTIFWGDEKGTLGLAETSEFLRRAEDPSYTPAVLLRDPEIAVYYQSLGVLASGAKRSAYRVLTGSSDGPLLIRDYTITHRVGDTPAVVTGKSKVTPVCTNFSARGFSLPMLSKNGARLAVNTDFTGRFGLVYEMSPRNPGSCTEVASLDTPISKAAFSFDGARLAFAAGAGGVYVYEFATKKLVRLDGIDAAAGLGTPEYPEWREDGSLLIPWVRDGGGVTLVELEY